MTKFFDWPRTSYARKYSRRRIAAAAAKIINAMTANTNDQEMMLNFGYISQSRRYALKPKMTMPKKVKTPVDLRIETNPWNKNVGGAKRKKKKKLHKNTYC